MQVLFACQHLLESGQNKKVPPKKNNGWLCSHVPMAMTAQVKAVLGAGLEHVVFHARMTWRAGPTKCSGQMNIPLAQAFSARSLARRRPKYLQRLTCRCGHGHEDCGDADQWREGRCGCHARNDHR